MGEAFLTDPTRLAKRNLMGLSLIAITLKSFHVNTKELDTIMGKVAIEPAGLAFMVMASIAYFAVTFIIYFWQDAKNTPMTGHQEQVKSRRKAVLEYFLQNNWSAVQQKLGRATFFTDLSERSLITITPQASKDLFANCVNTPIYKQVLGLDEKIKRTLRERQASITGNDLGVDTPNNKSGEDRIELALKIARSEIERLRWKYAFTRLKLDLAVLLTDSHYWFRRYGWDLLLPIVLFVFAVGVVYDVWTINPIKPLLPELAKPTP